MPAASFMTSAPPQVPAASFMTSALPQVPAASFMTSAPPQVPAASFMTSAPPQVLVTWQWLENLQSRRMSDEVCMMYKIMNSCRRNSAAGLLDPRNCSFRGHKNQLQVPHSRTDMYLYWNFPSAIRLYPP